LPKLTVAVLDWRHSQPNSIMTRRHLVLRSARLALLVVLSACAVLVLILRHRSPTISDRFYRARNGRFIQLDSRDFRMRLIFIHDYPNDEPLSWKKDILTDYLPGRAPAILAPVPLLRLTPLNEETAGPLAASKGLADKKPYSGSGGGYVISSNSRNKPPSNQYPMLSLHSPPSTKPVEKPPTLETTGAFNLGKSVPPPEPEPPVYNRWTATAMITGKGTPIRLDAAGANSVVVVNKQIASTIQPAAPASWPYRAYSLPHWLVALLIALYPLVCLLAFSRRSILRWRRGRTILCLNCGYDIRATPDRCPECGTTRAGLAQPVTSAASTVPSHA